MQIKSNAGKQVLQKMQSNAKVMRSNANENFANNASTGGQMFWLRC
jgi:hypothetical protein